MREVTAYLNRIATAVPEHDVHDVFVIFAEQMLANPRLRAVFRRMASRAEGDSLSVRPISGGDWKVLVSGDTGR